MGGVDASAGFAYQHAQAVNRVLDLMGIDNAGYVRVEATNDVVDVETYTGEDTLVRAAQFKIRDQKYTWGEAELVDELVRWSVLAVKYPGARYEFVTDGRLGPTGRKVQEALESARAGRTADLASIARGRNVTLDPATCARASIIAGTPGFDQLIGEAIDRAAGLLPHVTGELEAEERGTQLVHDLLRQVVGRSGDADPDARIITKAELDALLSDSREYVGTESWSTDLKSEFVEAVRRTSAKGVVLRCEVAGQGAQKDEFAGESARNLEELIGRRQVALLSGPTGTGKSTVIKQAQVAAAATGKVVIVVDAEGYIPKRLGSLIAHGINTPRFIGAYSATGLRALSDPTVTIIIDGVSEIPSDERAALKTELKQLIASDVHAKLVLAGRDSTILQGALPRHTPVSPIVVEKLNRARRLAILAEFSHERLNDREVQVLTAQVEHALQGAADNPQLFLIGTALIAGGCEFTDPASMYRQYVHARAEESGYTDATVLEVGLGIAFAELADSGRRYCDSFTWNEQLSAAASVLQTGGHDVTAISLREFGFETGLIIRTAGDVVRAVHDSFADYLSAAAHARGVARLPVKLQAGDVARLRFLVELAGITGHLSTQIASDLPFLVPSVAEREDLLPEASWCTTTQTLLASLWPSDVKPPRIAFWQSAGRCMVTVDGNLEGWLTERTLADVGTEAFTFEASNGPLNVAAKIWRRTLRTQFDRTRRGTTPLPATHEQTVRMLANYSDELLEVTHALARQIAPTGHQESVLVAIGPCRIQFAPDNDHDAVDQRERGLHFRYVDNSDGETSVVREIRGTPDESWTGHGCVDSFLCQDPTSTAARIVSDAVNRLAGRQWL